MSEVKQDAMNEDLHRGLQERHIQLIALGGAIGVGCGGFASDGMTASGLFRKPSVCVCCWAASSSGVFSAFSSFFPPIILQR